MAAQPEDGRAPLERVRCDLCDADDSEVLPWFHVSTPRGDLQLRRCCGCGLIYQSPRLPERDLATIYDQRYFEQGEFGGKDKDRSYFNPQEQADLNRFHRVILERIVGLRQPPASLLEVGCAGGHFLLLARDRGFAVRGVEISEWAAAQARERYRLEVATGTLEQVGFTDEQFDIIYLKDVLEHVRHPAGFLAECRRILRPGGLLVVLVPNYINTPMMRLYVAVWTRSPRLRRLVWGKRGHYLLDKPFHLYEFTRVTLRALLEKAGFSIARLDNYTLPPLKTRQGGRIVDLVRFGIRWAYYAVVSLGLLEGDRLDFYCLKQPGK